MSESTRNLGQWWTDCLLWRKQTAAQEVVLALRLTMVDLLDTLVGAAEHRPRYSLLLIWRSRGGLDSETGTRMV